jgi:hypothetical protein
MQLSSHTPVRKRRRRRVAVAALAGVAVPVAGTLGIGLLAESLTTGGCSQPSAAAGAAAVPGGRGTVVGASLYGPPGVDPTVHGNSGAYATLRAGDIARLRSGGPLFWQLRPLSLVRVTANTDRSVIARVADWGTGGGPVNGHPRAVDLWWQTADELGLPGASGAWLGLVRISRPPASGAGNLLAQTPPAPVATDPQSVACAQLTAATLSLVPGGRARILPDGSAAAPADSPAQVKAAIAAANEIHTKPYPEPDTHYDGNLAHPWPAYDCSGSASYVLWKAGLHSQSADVSGMLENWGEPGPGRWITVYANSTHTWVVIAGLAFDTADYGGPNIPAGTGPRWRQDATGNLADGLQYVTRHPPGL